MKYFNIDNSSPYRMHEDGKIEFLIPIGWVASQIQGIPHPRMVEISLEQAKEMFPHDNFDLPSIES